MSSAARHRVPRRDRAVRGGTTITGRWRRTPFPSGSAFPRRTRRLGAASIRAVCEDVA